jgi:hypothetical protein
VLAQLNTAWVGIDVGKTHHWVCVVDADGKVLLSVKVGNDEAEIVALLARVASLATRLIWAVDIIGAPSALVLALLARAGQPVYYASGRVVAAMSEPMPERVRPTPRMPTSSPRPPGCAGIWRPSMPIQILCATSQCSLGIERI